MPFLNSMCYNPEYRYNYNIIMLAAIININKVVTQLQLSMGGIIIIVLPLGQLSGRKAMVTPEKLL